MAGSLTLDGWLLNSGWLAPQLWMKVARGGMDEGRGAVIGRNFEREPEHLALEAMLNRPEVRKKRLSDAAIEELAKFVDLAGRQTKTILTLFGEESLTGSPAMEKAQLSAVIKKRLAEDRKLFGFVAEEDRAKKLAHRGSVLNVETNKQISADAAQSEDLYDRLARYKGPVSDVLHAGAKEIAGKGTRVSDVAKAIWPRIREAISETLTTRAQADVRGTGGDDKERGTEASERKVETVPAQGGLFLSASRIGIVFPKGWMRKAVSPAGKKATINVSMDDIDRRLQQEQAASCKSFDEAHTGLREQYPKLERQQKELEKALSLLRPGVEALVNGTGPGLTQQAAKQALDYYRNTIPALWGTETGVCLSAIAPASLQLRLPLLLTPCLAGPHTGAFGRE